MGKKTKRIPNSEINTHQKELVSKTVNIILTSGSVLFGDIISISNDHITLKNRRNENIGLHIKDINEIILDYKS